MNYEEYNNILRYLDNNDINGLRNYIEIEKELYYIDNFRKEFVKYMAYARSCYGYIKDYLLITNGSSVYLLNNDEMLSKYYKKKISGLEESEITKDLLHAYKALLYYSKLKSSDIKSLKSCSYKEYEIKSEVATHYFSKELYNESKIILGGDINYNLADESSVLQVSSPKGKDIVLGIKRN